MPYKTVVFDFFGVISSEIAPFWLSERFAADAARRIKSGLIGDADRGLITRVKMFEKLAALSGSSPARVEAEWRKRRSEKAPNSTSTLRATSSIPSNSAGGIVTLASFTCQWRDALMGRTQRNQWLAEFESGTGHLENPLFLADVTMPC